MKFELGQEVLVLSRDRVKIGVVDGRKLVQHRQRVLKHDYLTLDPHERINQKGLGRDTEVYSIQLDDNSFVTKQAEEVFDSIKEITAHLLGDI